MVSISDFFLVAATLLLSTKMGCSQCILGNSQFQITDSTLVNNSIGSPNDSLFTKQQLFIKETIGKYSKLLKVSCSEIKYNNSNNAFADPKTNNIIIGKQLLYDSINKPNGKTILQFILAHELSHLFQFKKGLAQNPYYNELTHKHLELQADFLGAYTFFKATEYDDKKLETVIQAVNGAGDYGFTDSLHHGTPAQRIKAVTNGSYFHNLAVDDAFATSPDYVFPSAQIKQFSKNNFIGHIIIKGKYLFYLNYDNELFIKKKKKYIQVGAIREIPEKLATFKLDIRYKKQFINYTVSWKVVYDENNTKVGDFIFYSKLFSK